MSKLTIFLRNLFNEVGESRFKEIFQMTIDDIEFNRTGFNKTTNSSEFMLICSRCKNVFIRY